MNMGRFSTEKLQSLAAVARGDEPADILLINGKLVNVHTGEIAISNIAIKGDTIAAIGKHYEDGVSIFDLAGKYVTPGLIDAHLHIESTLLFPPELSKLLVAHGTTTVIHDPHEIANVFGIDGVKIMLSAVKDLPCDFYATAPSCVPATTFESAGAELTVSDITALLKEDGVVGLGEMMNYPGVIAGDEAVMAKIAAAHKVNKLIDGHAPAVSGSDLQAYLSAGISTDHECVSAGEAKEKISSGMKVIIRHGSATSSLAELLPLVNENNINVFMVGSDDREAGDLLKEGHLNNTLKVAVSLGADPLLLIKAATINPAEHYRLYDRGVIAPGYRADLTVFEDLKGFRTSLVIKNGFVAAESGKALPLKERAFRLPDEILTSVRVGRRVEKDDFVLHYPSGSVTVIGLLEGQLVTEKLHMDLPRGSRGEVLTDITADVVKVAVVERHHASGRIGLALVRGVGLREGAIASTVAHDSHNIIVVGVEEEAMAAAVNALVDSNGGFVVVSGNGEVKGLLPLPVAGLMSEEPAEIVATGMNNLLEAASALGCRMKQPFLGISFLALPVIPSLKITDRGLFDVDSFSYL